MLSYIAHRKEDTGEEQSLIDHLQGTAALAAQYAAAFGAEEWGRLCGLAHDLGKYSAEFQARIRSAALRVDHATAGSKELFDRKALYAAFCVAGHHGGLPDGGTPRDAPEEPTLLGRVKRAPPNDIPDYNAWKSELALPNSPSAIGKGMLADAFFTRMLYSCLVDADFLDTEAFFSESPVLRGAYEPPTHLFAKLEAHIAGKRLLAPENNLNRQRADILAACMDGAAKPKGLYSLTVPTGGGKTISSLAFAMRHAALHGMGRVVYVIPYCSIIDQTAAIFRDIFGEENVLEHHSGVSFELGEPATLARRKMAWAAENWDAPIVITTAVQFFESLYANRSSQCRKLHNLANSVVVFDEAQMLPLPCLLPCVSAIGQLVEHFGTTAVLCTATQPALDGIFKHLGHMAERIELCPEEKSIQPVFRRVCFQKVGLLENEELSRRLNAEKQVLCILNSRAQAQEIYRQLEGEGNIHLSTLMVPAHRTHLLGEIRSRLKNDRPCRVVSTSLIEAGVDVDFPTVYRAEAGLDSILQAAGRCNREGTRKAEESIVTIFKTAQPPPRMMAANVGAARETLHCHEDPAAPEAIGAYFRTLLDLKGADALDQYNVLDAFRRGLDGSYFPFKTIAERFHIIDSSAETVYIPLEEGRQLVEAIRQYGVSRLLLRKLGRYGVTVYPRHFEALLRAGDIETVAQGVPVLVNMNLYSMETGLSLTAEEGKGYFV